jgi:hypothetical protein
VVQSPLHFLQNQRSGFGGILVFLINFIINQNSFMKCMKYNVKEINNNLG